MAYIYTYTHKETGKTYIGSRCKYKGLPEDDFNIKYFSSSKNPEFIKDLNDGMLEGNIILEMSDSEQCVRLENMMIKAYWKQYGKENSYNRSWCIGKEKQFNSAGSKRPGRIPWNKGLHTGPNSEESNKKRSESLKGKNTWSKGRKWHKKNNTQIPWNKGLKGVQKGNHNPMPKRKWMTPDGDIREMTLCNRNQHHPDWILVE